MKNYLFKYSKKNLTFILVRMLQYLKKKFKFYFCPQKFEKSTLKSCSEILRFFSSLLSWAAQTAETEEFLSQNVAYTPTVYKTGILPMRSVRTPLFNHSYFRLYLHPAKHVKWTFSPMAALTFWKGKIGCCKILTSSWPNSNSSNCSVVSGNTTSKVAVWESWVL